MKIKNIFIFTVIFVIALSGFSSPALALSPAGDSTEVPYTTHNYFYGEEATAVGTKAVYTVENVLTAANIGVESFSELNDICTDKDNNIYILDGKGSRIVIVNSQYQTIGEITEISDGENSLKFSGAQGIFVYGNGDIYIADTASGRVLVTDKSGVLKKTVLLPESNLIPDDFNYRPIKVTVDSSGYLYVLSDGSYYGAILYSPDGKFLGFYGANSVENTITQVLKKFWDMLTSTNAKKANQGSNLPYQFTDLYVDEKDFIYTATGKTTMVIQKGQIKQLSPGGHNILDSEGVVFGDVNVGTVNKQILTQNVAGMAVDSNDYIYCYDIAYGRVYVYDKELYMLAAFGGGAGEGKQMGTFQLIGAIDILDDGDRIAVLDTLKSSVTVFSVTDFGKRLKQARTLTLKGSYKEAEPIWKELILEDRNCQLANIGIAKSALFQKDYKTALKYAKDGMDNGVYSKAFTYLRKDFLKANFNVISIIVILILAVIFALIYIIKKKNIAIIRSEAVKQMLSAPFHPAVVFDDVKRKKGGSVFLGVIIMLVFYISAIIKSTKSGFLFQNSGTSFNSVLVLLQTVGFILLWTLTNWAIATLLGGIGKPREIFIVITYSIQPLIVGNIIYTVFSYGLNLSEGKFLSVFATAMVLFSVFIVIIGSIKIHDISFGSFLWISFLTFIGMLIVILLFALVVILVQQTGGFIGTMINELFFR